MARLSWPDHNQVKAAAALLALVGGVIGYVAARREFRVRESLGYIQRSREGAVGNASDVLVRFWQSELGRSLWDDVSESDFQARVAIAVEQASLVTHVREVHGFYDEVALCVQSRACDSRTTCRFFFREMMAFGNTYQNYLNDWSKDWGEDVFRNVRHFLNEECRDQRAAYSDRQGRMR